jgi:hypothetical protein
MRERLALLAEEVGGVVIDTLTKPARSNCNAIMIGWFRRMRNSDVR